MALTPNRRLSRPRPWPAAALPRAA